MPLICLKIPSTTQVLFHLGNQASELERHLRHYCTLLHTPLSGNLSAVRSEYIRVSEALNLLRGLRTAVREGRNVTKRICQQHRMPGYTAAQIQNDRKNHVFSASPYQEFANLSAVLKKLKSIEKTVLTCQPHANQAAHTDIQHHDLWNAFRAELQVFIDRPRDATQGASKATESAVADFGIKILIARGVAKAFQIWSNLHTYSAFVESHVSTTKSFLRNLRGGVTPQKVPAVDRLPSKRKQHVNLTASSPTSNNRGQTAPVERQSMDPPPAVRKRQRQMKGRVTVVPQVSSAKGDSGDTETILNSVDTLTAGVVAHVQHSQVLRGCLLALEDLAHGCRSILGSPTGEGSSKLDLRSRGNPLFRCGDLDPAAGVGSMVVPQDFSQIITTLEGLQGVITAAEPAVTAQLQVTGWPPVAASHKELAEIVKGREKCKGPCEGSFTSLWIRQGKCCFCEAKDRRLGKCAFASTRLCQQQQKRYAKQTATGLQGVLCNPNFIPLWCPHSNKCLACDTSASCGQCRLWRMDGEEILSLVRTRFKDKDCRQRVRLVCVDWDQTMCCTRRGNAPILSKHTIEANLLALYRWCRGQKSSAVAGGTTSTTSPKGSDLHDVKHRGNKHEGATQFCVVTRNRHHADIVRFLKAHDVQADVICVAGTAANKGSTRGGPAVSSSKGTVVIDLAAKRTSVADGDVTLFVDDTLAELMTPGELRQSRHIIRILFMAGSQRHR